MQGPFFLASLINAYPDMNFAFPIVKARIPATGNYVDTNEVTVNSNKGLVLKQVGGMGLAAHVGASWALCRNFRCGLTDF